MCLCQKMIPTLGSWSREQPKWYRGNSFKRWTWETILYFGLYGMQHDHKSSWEQESQAPSQPLSIPGAILPKRPNSNVFKRENQKASMGWNEKRILWQLCLEFCRKDIISNMCFTVYLKIRLFIKLLGFSIRSWLCLEMLNCHTCEMLPSLHREVHGEDFSAESAVQIHGPHLFAKLK